jgi:hypothetical protein
VLHPLGYRPSTRTGWDEWTADGERIQSAARSSMWWLGDWLCYGDVRWGDRAEQAVDNVGLDFDTIRAARWVAMSIEFDRRRATLSWSHHQDRWLDLAETHGWSRDALRARIRQERIVQTASPDATAAAELATRQSTLREALHVAFGEDIGVRAYGIVVAWARRNAPGIVAVLSDG